MGIDFFTTLDCRFCLKMDFMVLLNNLSVPVQDEVDVIWDDSGDPKVNKLIDAFGNLVPLPVLFKEGEVNEVVSGVYGNPRDIFLCDIKGNLDLIDSLKGGIK